MLGPWEVFAILAVLLLLFGAKRLPELAKGLGKGIREFKKASHDVEQELHRVIEEEPPPPPPRPRPATPPPSPPSPPSPPAEDKADKSDA